MTIEVDGEYTTAEVMGDEEMFDGTFFNQVEEEEYPWRNEEILEELYINREMNMKECSDVLGCAVGTISKWMRKHNVPRRNKAEQFAGGYINVTEKHHEIITGLLMSDGCLLTRDRTPSLQLRMITKPFLEWLDDKFGRLSTGVRLYLTAEENAFRHRDSGFNPNADPENYKDMYALNTRSVSELERYIKWYRDGEKVWPEDIELSPLTLKMFYCGDGNMKDDSRSENRQPYIRFRADNEFSNKKKVIKMFEDVGFEASWPGDDLHISVEESKRVWEYMGTPPPGFKYKWPQDFVEGEMQ